MLRLGLSGGVAAGKSAASEVFRTLGAPIVDADVIARSLLERGSEAYLKARELFGSGILDEEKNIERRSLRKIVFSDPAKRRALEAICHPLARKQIVEEASALNAIYCVLSIPLLVESKMVDLTDKIAIVDCREALQITRLCQRDGCDRDDALAMIRAQASRDERLAAADYVIENNGSRDELKMQVRKLHELLVSGEAV